MIADRRKEQSAAASGKNTGGGTRRNSARNKEKKTAMADRSVATGRAKRAAATRARRNLSTAKKPTAMEVEKEVYRQSRKTATFQKQAEKKASHGRAAPNSSLRAKHNPKKYGAADPPGVLVGRMPSKLQVQAAMQGMAEAGFPMPDGYQLVMQFSPLPTNEKPKGKQTNANNKNNGRNNNNTKSNNKGKNNAATQKNTRRNGRKN